MFDGLPTSLSTLDKDARSNLAKLLSDRNAYLAKSIELNRLRIEMLQNPTPENEARVNDFNSTVVAPLRDGMLQQITLLIKEAINVEGLKGILPLILMGVMQSINLPLLFATFGFEPDMVEKIIGEINKFIKSGF